MLSFTPIDQNQDCVAENSVNLFQGNIIDDVLPLVFYEPSATQWLVHEEFMRNPLILDSTTQILFLMNIKLKKMCRVLYHHSQKFQTK
jgi:hypothetical protein